MREPYTEPDHDEGPGLFLSPAFYLLGLSSIAFWWGVFWTWRAFA